MYIHVHVKEICGCVWWYMNKYIYMVQFLESSKEGLLKNRRPSNNRISLKNRTVFFCRPGMSLKKYSFLRTSCPELFKENSQEDHNTANWCKLLKSWCVHDTGSAPNRAWCSPKSRGCRHEAKRWPNLPIASGQKRTASGHQSLRSVLWISMAPIQSYSSHQPMNSKYSGQSGKAAPYDFMWCVLPCDLFIGQNFAVKIICSSYWWLQYSNCIQEAGWLSSASMIPTPSCRCSDSPSKRQGSRWSTDWQKSGCGLA